jgi:glycosyltransferase involved in cell wall biosynthesis
MAIVRIDYTHVGRRASGIERITTAQFNGTALSPLDVRPFNASGNRLQIMAAQMIGLPACALGHRSDVFVFPGFPPSPYFAFAADRSVLYVHDLFLLTRRPDLNRAAKYYMAPLFAMAVSRFRYFLTNSQDTARQLQSRCHPGATVIPYRPRIENVFGLAVGDRAARPAKPPALRVLSIGTVEPRKNFVAAADICAALAARLGRPVEYHIIGRIGWGGDADLLRRRPNVFLHGFLGDAQARPLIESADILLCTSHAEGLGLPLIEAQYCGIPIVAPQGDVFSEVLGASGLFIDTASPERAAERIAEAMSSDAWRTRHVAASTANVARWNALADNDRGEVVALLSRLGATVGSVH